MHELSGTRTTYLQKHLMREPNEAWVSVLGKVGSHNFLAFTCLVHLEQDLCDSC